MNNDNRTIDVGHIPCPDWCTAHHGEKPRADALLTGDEFAAESRSIGRHRTSLLHYRRWESFPHPTAVEVRQEVTTLGQWGTEILFWHGVTGVDDMPGEAPVTHTSLTASEARELGTALLRAADLAGEILPARCECGEPIIPTDSVCTRCRVKANVARHAARRSNLTVVNN